MKQSNLLNALQYCYSEVDNPKILKTLIVITDCKIERTEETLLALQDMRSCSRVAVVNLSAVSNFAANNESILRYNVRNVKQLQRVFDELFDLTHIATLMNPRIGKYKFQCITTGVLTPVFCTSAVLMKRKTITVRGTIQGKVFKKVVTMSTTANPIPVTTLMDFYCMKRRNFIAPEWKLSGGFEVKIFVPSNYS